MTCALLIIPHRVLLINNIYLVIVKKLRRSGMKEKKYPIHKNVVERFSEKNTIELYEKLIDKKTEFQNKPQASKKALSKLGNERGGDQADLVNRLQEESQYTGRIQRDTRFLEEIINALARMETGQYGICRITEEPIEMSRLYSIPWTSLSIEGAEEQEDNIKKFGSTGC